MRRMFHPETNGVKASPHGINGCSAVAHSHPWDFDASDVPPAKTASASRRDAKIDRKA
jgi:hypothetical protein